MKISWNINKSDIQKIKNVMNENDNFFLKNRRERNVQKKNIDLSKNIIIQNLMMCLLTSQQRSGPNSLVGKFLSLKPFPITSELIGESENIELLIKQILQKNGLTRYINKISSFFAENIEKIELNNWNIISKLEYLNNNQSKETERELADFLNDWLKGFGPKQSRNFLQSLGLTKYELPIDSRIASWLNDFGFPVSLTSSPLSDKGYYHFVSDGIQELCLKAKIYPCELDAVIFSSFDNNEWNEKNIMN
jgi:N-glycosylase/DNA lyase